MTIEILTNIPNFANDIADVARMMLPGALVRMDSTDSCEADARLVHRHESTGGYWHERCEFGGESFDWRVRVPKQGALTADTFILNEKRLMKRAVKMCAYYLLKNVTRRRPPWGALTGIRPTRLYAERLSSGDTDPERTMIQSFDVRPDKASLLKQICSAQSPYLAVDPREVDVYIGIPYCVTRCAYCSFKTEPVPKDLRVLDRYIDALIHEIESTRLLIDRKNLCLRAMYMGGGTPTALPAPQLDHLLTALVEAFPNAQEFTVEAGRPDTLDDERLSALRSHPVTRVSVNPQTMNDSTLERIGRRHTSAQTIDAFNRARAMGFLDINMDLIAALPGETIDDFANTLNIIQSLQPDSLTIHTLARKRSSRLYEDAQFTPTASETVEEMIRLGGEFARAMGMTPYYLYRQKQIAGDQENVGYARRDSICIYNIDMMEETASILALGAGGISKRVTYAADGRLHIERAPNMMESARYIERVGEMIQRKERLWGMIR